MNKILVFDLWGDLGHFKKPYTTTSPLTYSFPPRPTISGIISAIIGLDKNEYANHFQKKQADITLRLIKPVKKIRISQNLIDTKKAVLFSRIKQRTQVRIEYVKDAKYRIYFRHKNYELFNKFKILLSKHECVYTVSLGLSELLANFQFIGVFQFEKRQEKKHVMIHSLIPSQDTDVEFESGKEYFSSNVPIEMNQKRIVTSFGSVLYERNGHPIKAKTNSFVEVENGENIIFL